MNIFQFKHVGQGLFYTGSILGDFNFVFDCGSTRQGLSHLRQEIQNTHFESSGKEIDFVVISHLHYDHYSGLPDLCKKFNVKKVYLPYLGENKELIKLILVNSLIQDDSVPDDEYIRLYTYMCHLYRVEEIHERNYQFIYPEDVRFLGGNESKDPLSRQSDYVISTYNDIEECPFWCFRFVNRAFTQKWLNNAKKRFIPYLQKYNNNGSFNMRALDNDILSKISDLKGLKELRSLYESVFGKRYLNISSTVLIHYPKIKSYSTTITEYNQPLNIALNLNLNKFEGNISVLTGDAEFDPQNRMLDYILYINELNKYGAVLQIPHHGSYTNWESLKFLPQFFKAFIIPVGKNNHGHPDSRVLSELSTIRENSYINFASENTGIVYFIG